MSITVFYSWQSELPENINRYLIRDALNEAMQIIKQDYGLNERPEVDHDTRGIPGLPDIVKTIFSKIESSSAFVADVSFTSKSEKSRLCANANVLIELGFALHSLGDERLILVMNDVFGSPQDQMPFNLAARRWPIIFTLSPSTDNQTRQKVRKDLSSKIAIAFKTMAESGVLFSPPTTNLSIQTDRQLFTRLLEQFPPNGEIAYFLNECDVGDTILSQWLRSIDNFITEWSNSLHEFIDPLLESKRLELLAKLTLFRQDLSLNIWPHNSDSYSMKMDDFDFENPRWKKRDELNAMATESYKAHQELIRACKAKLGLPLK